MRRRRNQLVFGPTQRGSEERQSPKTVGVVAVVVAVAITGGVVGGMKLAASGGTSLDVSGGDPSASASARPPTSAKPSDPVDRPAGNFATRPPRGQFIDIRKVPRAAAGPRPGRDASTGTFVSRCGTNQNDHNNTDNYIVAPGVVNGAHHLHDYVGNLSTDAFSTDESLAAAGTTCRLGDKSTYYWPVLRVPGNAVGDTSQEGNVGQILRPTSVTLQFRGSVQGNVVPMPRFLRMITGNAKAATQEGANAKAAWSCTGFTDRVTIQYPLCPRGSQVVRTLDFPSCWDGERTDSANHRDHIVFPAASGACPSGTRAVPQLRMRLTYRVPPGPSYAIDTFPEQLHNPVTDHGDFENLMPTRLMNKAVSCINRDRTC
jgi:hypothetical protein